MVRRQRWISRHEIRLHKLRADRHNPVERLPEPQPYPRAHSPHPRVSCLPRAHRRHVAQTSDTRQRLQLGLVLRQGSVAVRCHGLRGVRWVRVRVRVWVRMVARRVAGLVRHVALAPAARYKGRRRGAEPWSADMCVVGIVSRYRLLVRFASS